MHVTTINEEKKGHEFEREKERIYGVGREKSEGRNIVFIVIILYSLRSF